MSRICEFTGKRPNFGNTVSHANNKNRTRWELNLKQKAYEVPELGRTVRVNLSTRAIRTIDKYGNFTLALMKAKSPDKMSPRLQKLRRQVYKRRVDQAKPKSA